MYSQSITRTHRTAFVLLVDCSGSMAEEIGFRGELRPKAEVVAAICNELIFELIERARRSEGVRNYYDLALVGYGGRTEVFSLTGDREPRFTAIDELAMRTTEVEHRTIEVRRPDGSMALHRTATPCWMAPRAEGETPMLEAFRVARDLVKGWVGEERNRASFPPIIFHITDGEMTDGHPEELRSVAEEIRSLATQDGHVLLINLHLASDERGRTLLLPAANEILPEQRNIELLYALSSELPSCFNELIDQLKGVGGLPPYRAMCYNTSAAELLTVLDIGSISVKTE